ncbi:hypothetical protein [Nocardia sp. NPDC059239]|uniref:hypothetical protein n=1 Tax=unclassified Nocardia TaxID=2637762 RepID=UPI0036B7C5C2
MARIRVKFNFDAFEQIRRAPGVSADLKDRADAIAKEARERSGEDGYTAEASRGHSRDRAAVITTTWQAIRDNADNHTLLKSMDAGR